MFPRSPVYQNRASSVHELLVVFREHAGRTRRQASHRALNTLVLLHHVQLALVHGVERQPRLPLPEHRLPLAQTPPRDRVHRADDVLRPEKRSAGAGLKKKRGRERGGWQQQRYVCAGGGRWEELGKKKIIGREQGVRRCRRVQGTGGREEAGKSCGGNMAASHVR